MCKYSMEILLHHSNIINLLPNNIINLLPNNKISLLLNNIISHLHNKEDIKDSLNNLATDSLDMYNPSPVMDNLNLDNQDMANLDTSNQTSLILTKDNHNPKVTQISNIID